MSIAGARLRARFRIFGGFGIFFVMRLRLLLFLFCAKINKRVNRQNYANFQGNKIYFKGT